MKIMWVCLAVVLSLAACSSAGFGSGQVYGQVSGGIGHTTVR